MLLHLPARRWGFGRVAPSWLREQVAERQPLSARLDGGRPNRARSGTRGTRRRIGMHVDSTCEFGGAFRRRSDARAATSAQARSVARSHRGTGGMGDAREGTVGISSNIAARVDRGRRRRRRRRRQRRRVFLGVPLRPLNKNTTSEALAAARTVVGRGLRRPKGVARLCCRGHHAPRPATMRRQMRGWPRRRGGTRPRLPPPSVRWWRLETATAAEAVEEEQRL